jgi:hypothetical protein
VQLTPLFCSAITEIEGEGQQGDIIFSNDADA